MSSAEDRRRRRARTEPAIWAARVVEWPIPGVLSTSQYVKLSKTSKQLGQQLGIGEPLEEDSHTGAGSDSNYFSGFMSRVLNTSSEEKPANIGGEQYRLRAPRSGCASSANGWIVGAVECADHPLRLLSRWNVRRGGLADHWMALPPPVSGDGRLTAVLCDPTASHVLICAANGEAYYSHSSHKQVVKLHGFGPAADGAAVEASGITAASVARRKKDDVKTVQTGLTPGSSVTAVAWDKERGTEGSTKAILLGTSAGEIYEYALTSPSSEDADKELAPPTLLHKLYAEDETPAAVTGLYMERLRTGVLVLVSTSGRHKRTRFYTFYSPNSSSLAMVFADQQHMSLTELPGSVDFADLRLCGDHFGLRTSEGIYYGKIDRALSGPKVAGPTTMVVDAGILPYDGPMPVSLAITPHHLITLSESNEVRFINRVAGRVIQKERIDIGPMSSTLDESHLGVGEFMLDIRRPDQVWLRKARSLVHISSSQEDRDVWKFTLQKCLDWKSRVPATTPDASRSTRTRWTTDRLFLGDSAMLTEDERAQEALFEQAKSLCTNAGQKAVVTAIRAEYHLSQGRAELAAKYLAQCPANLEPFADTAIRLALPKLGIDDPKSYGHSWKARASLEASNTPLIAYLSDKMRAGAMNDDKMTSTMIGAWLTELYLHERAERLSSAALEDDKAYKDIEASQKAMLARFLNSNVNNTDAKTIMKILTSHDVGATECATYAAMSGDISTAVNAALSVGANNATGAYEALQILNDAPFELAESLYYKHAPILLARAPAAAGESFLRRYAQGLSPLRLLPSIMHYEQARATRNRFKHLEGQKGIEESKSIVGVSVEGARGSADGFEMQVNLGTTRTTSFVDDGDVSTKYLEGVIRQGCRSTAVFSYLISLYAKLDDEEPLYAFLSTHVPATSATTEAAKRALLSGGSMRMSPEDELASPLDMSYALRTVLGTGRHFRSAIKLYMGFGMRQQAVELALKVDPSLARELAQDSVELDERKRLWLMIAKNAASNTSARGGKDVVSSVVSVLKDCGPDVLSIEDVLPFLPDFAQIDQIKDEICEALTSYSSKIDAFLKEMSDCDQVCDDLRAEIGRLRNHRMSMKADARCAITNKLALSAGEPFYIFPSGYVILASALKKEVMPFLNAKQQARVAELEGLLKSSDQKNRDELQAELDGLIAAECPLTGSVMVESINREFEGATEIEEMSSQVERAEV